MICCEGCDLWYHKHGEKFYLVHVCSTCSNVLHNCYYHYLLIGRIFSSKILLIEVICVPWDLCFIVDFPEDNLLRSKLSPGQSTPKQVVPPDTLLRSKMSSGHFTSKQTVPSQGGNLLRGGSLSFEVKCPGRTICFEVKCPGDSLLRSNSPPGHYTSGGKLLRDSAYFLAVFEISVHAY